jgi:hypothetical protein
MRLAKATKGSGRRTRPGSARIPPGTRTEPPICTKRRSRSRSGSPRNAWFDALFSIDAFHDFGMSDDYLTSYARLVEPGGEIGVVDVVLADEMTDGRELWLRFLEANAAWMGRGAREDQPDAELLREHGEALGFTRLVGRRR